MSRVLDVQKDTTSGIAIGAFDNCHRLDMDEEIDDKDLYANKTSAEEALDFEIECPEYRTSFELTSTALSLFSMETYPLDPE